jgi:molecular chaperone HscB
MGSIPASPTKRDGAMRPAGKASCWQCGADHAVALFCPACNAIQPFPEEADYFQVMGVPRRLVVDAAALQDRYYELHRCLHPDRFQTGRQEARVASLRNTATVNRAYQTLRDPVDRGLYWLALQGESLGGGDKRVPPELAELVFEVQEQLAEFRAARTGNGRAAMAAEIAAAQTELRQRHAALLEHLEENFSRWDSGGADTAQLTRELKAILSALAYVGTLLRSVEKELEV